MSNEQLVIKQGFEVNGQFFSSKKEALATIQKPKVLEALQGIDGIDSNTAEWLYDNQDEFKNVFKIGAVARVTLSERKALRKAVEFVVKNYSEQTELAFLVKNAETVIDSFKFPTVSRRTPEQVAEEQAAALFGLVGQPEVATHLFENKDAVLEAFDAGRVKREINPKALERLAEYRAQKAAEKAAAQQA